MKYHGNLGFTISAEKIIDNEPTGVWEDSVIEKPYYGEVLKKSYRWSKSDQLNDDIEIGNELSIVCDSFIKTNVGTLKYAIWNGTRWKITSADIEYPRIHLTLGGVYNGATPGST